MCTMSLNIQLKSAMAALTSYTIGTVPTGYRPVGTIDFTTTSGVDAASFYVYVTSDGKVTIFTGATAIKTDDTIAFTLSWVV